MNKELVLIGGGVAGGALSRGVTGLFPATANPMLVNGVMAIASGFAITKVSGTTTKDNVVKGMLIGATIVKGLDFVKNVFEKTGISTKLENPTKVNQFLKGATGLGCPMDDGLAGTMRGADGQLYEYDETGLQGTYMDANGNVQYLDDNGLGAVMIGNDGVAYEVDESGLSGTFMDENGNVFNDGLAGVEEEILGFNSGLNGIEQDIFGLNGIEQDLYGLNGDFDEYEQ